MGKQVAKILLFAGGVWLMVFLCCGGGYLLTKDDSTATPVETAKAESPKDPRPEPPAPKPQMPPPPQADIAAYARTLPGYQLDQNGPGIITSISVSQVIDNFSFIAEHNGEPVYVVGYSTEGMVDGRDYVVSGVFVPAGTHAYLTVLGGRRTIHKIRHLTERELVSLAINAGY